MGGTCGSHAEAMKYWIGGILEFFLKKLWQKDPVVGQGCNSVYWSVASVPHLGVETRAEFCYKRK